MSGNYILKFYIDKEKVKDEANLEKIFDFILAYLEKNYCEGFVTGEMTSEVIENEQTQGEVLY